MKDANILTNIRILMEHGLPRAPSCYRVAVREYPWVRASLKPSIHIVLISNETDSEYNSHYSLMYAQIGEYYNQLIGLWREMWAHFRWMVGNRGKILS